MKKIYIASPYTKGWMPDNVRESMKFFNILAQKGYAPFSPLLFHFQEIMYPGINYDAWLNMDLIWLASCDAVLRLPGESKGADIETTKAAELNIPVFYTVEELYKNI
jgi:hypothetical protein